MIKQTIPRMIMTTDKVSGEDVGVFNILTIFDDISLRISTIH